MDASPPLSAIFAKFNKHLRYNLAKHWCELPASAVTIIDATDDGTATLMLAVEIRSGGATVGLEYSALGEDIAYRFSKEGVQVHQGVWSHHSAASRCRVILRIDVLRLKALLPTTPPG